MPYKIKAIISIILPVSFLYLIYSCSPPLFIENEKDVPVKGKKVAYINPVIIESRQSFRNSGYGYHNNSKKGTEDAFLREFGQNLKKHGYEWKKACVWIQKECEEYLGKQGTGMVFSLPENILAALKEGGTEYLVMIYNLKYSVVSANPEKISVIIPRRKKELSFFCSVIDIENNSSAFFSSENYESAGDGLDFMGNAVDSFFKKITTEKNIR